MLKRIRQMAALVSVTLITLLFVDFTGTSQTMFGWMAKIQFLPALLSLNLIVVACLIILTLLFGRLYCSVICPLGIMQDGFAWFGKKSKKNRYSYSKPLSWLRYAMLGAMAISILGGLMSLAALIAPYSAYGRIAQSLFAPVWQWMNNLLASWSEARDNYMFYNVEIWSRGVLTTIVAVVTLVVLAFLSWRNGRTYCNTVCPVGTVLGFFSRFSLLRPVIDTSKCNSCGLCARNCKSACINSKEHTIDLSRCVTCFDCIGKCNKGAISYAFRSEGKENASGKVADPSRRQFLAMTATLTATGIAGATEKTVDGGLAAITEKKIPNRKRKIVPPGAISINNLASHCTACQLCVSVCPN
ncbi:MAG: 4Fe-4S binding protein, partial [Duncaniella sp.]|nr:4Fe-4S binding protein [Duncaniella sp.]